MQTRFILQWLTILSFFVVALVLELAPWPLGFQAFKPAWLVLVLLYWVLAIPNKVIFVRACMGFNPRFHIRHSCISPFCDNLFCGKKLSRTQKFITLVSKPFSDCVCVYCQISYFLSRILPAYRIF